MARSKKDSAKIYKIISIIAVVIAGGLLIWMIFLEKDPITYLLPIEQLSTEGFSLANVEVSYGESTGIVTITSGCYQISANTDISQVESISNGQEGKIGLRPNTHDLFKDALEGFNVEVLMVKITEMKNSTYIGKLILKQDDRIMSLDSRPSDGVAIAVRTNTPVYINDDLLKSEGENIC